MTHKGPSGIVRSALAKNAAWFFILFFVSCVYVALPFEEYLNKPFRDRAVYLKNFETGYPEAKLHILNSLMDPLQSLTNEHLWLVIIFLLRDVFGSFEMAIGIASAFSCMVFLAIMVKATRAPLAAIVLFHPLITGLLMSQVRAALAMAVLYVAWRWKDLLTAPRNSEISEHREGPVEADVFGRPNWSWYIRGILALSACFIHTGMALLIAIILVGYLVRHVADRNQPTATALTWAGIAVVGITLTRFRQPILEALGDRRAEYDFIAPSTVEMIIWSVFFIYLIIRSSVWFRDVAATISVICLGVFLMASASGFPGMRIFALSIPLFLGALNCFRGPEKLALWLWFFAAYALYLGFNYRPLA